jgi:hypothetical protein
VCAIDGTYSSRKKAIRAPCEGKLQARCDEGAVETYSMEFSMKHPSNRKGRETSRGLLKLWHHCSTLPFALADMLRTDMHKYRSLEYSSEEIRKLKILCGEYSKLTKDKNIFESQLYNVLSKYYPITLTLFYKYNCKILYKLVLKYSTYEELRKVSFEDLEKFLKKNR